MRADRWQWLPPVGGPEELTRGAYSRFGLTLEDHMGPKNDDNRSNQLNPNNDSYWQSRGEDDRPDDWEGQVADDEEDGGEVSEK